MTRFSFESIKISTDKLENLLDYIRKSLKKGSCNFSLLINILNCILQIDPTLLRQEDIELLLRLLQKVEINEIDYLTICQFFLQALSNPALAKSIQNSQLILALTNIDRFNNLESFNSCSFYERDLRDNEHILWLWTLQVVNMAYNFMQKQIETLSYTIGFVKKFQSRISMILSYKFGEFVNSRVENTGPSLPFRTNAYMEELDLTIALISQMFSYSDEWKAKSKSQFEYIFFLLVNRTIKLFSHSTSSFAENFVPVSYLEKIAQKLQFVQKSSRDNSTAELGHKTSANGPMSVPKASLSLGGRKNSHISDFGGAYRN